MTAAKPEGFVVGTDIDLGADGIDPGGTVIPNAIMVRLQITYPPGTDLHAYEERIQRAIVGLMPGAYVELERRAG